MALRWTDRTFRFDLPVELFPVVIERLRGAAPRIEDKVRGLSPEVLTRRDGGAWSIQEHVGHLLDLDEFHLSRLDDFEAGVEVLRAADVANLKTWEANHNLREIGDLIERFRGERQTFVERLETWDPERLGHAALHPRLKQPMRVVDMAFFVAEHDDHHLARMTELARLNPIPPLPSPLPRHGGEGVSMIRCNLPVLAVLAVLVVLFSGMEVAPLPGDGRRDSQPGGPMRKRLPILLLPLLLGACTYEDATDEKKPPKDPYEQAKLECLCYSSPLELFAERGHAAPELVQKLNPQVDFANLSPGTELVLPDVPQAAVDEVKSQSKVKPAQAPPASGQVTQILISKQGFYLQALDAQGHILYHFPSTLGSKYDPSATGTLQLTGIHPEPDFHYQPSLFADVSDEKPEAHLPSGPNSPVGLVWMSLSKPHHGIHGTATPETIGYASSHGCVRLTNWDALLLAQNVKPGTPVVFRD